MFFQHPVLYVFFLVFLIRMFVSANIEDRAHQIIYLNRFHVLCYMVTDEMCICKLVNTQC